MKNSLVAFLVIISLTFLISPKKHSWANEEHSWANEQKSLTNYILDVRFDPQKARARGKVIINSLNSTGQELNKIPISLINDENEKELIKACLVNDQPAEFKYIFKTDNVGYTGIEIQLKEPIGKDEKFKISMDFTSAEVGYWYGYFHWRHGWSEESWHPTLMKIKRGQVLTGYQELADYHFTAKFPSDYKCALTGMVESQIVRNDSTELVASAYGVPDFGVLLSKDFIIDEADIAGVKVRSFYFEKDKKWGKTFLEMAKDIIPFYKEKIGFYPQPVLSILPGHTEPWGGYPICANCVVIHMGLEKKEDKADEFANWILAHEIGHQYFGFGNILEDTRYPRWFGLSMGIYTDRLYNSARGIELSSPVRRMKFYLAGLLAGINTTILQKTGKLDKEQFDWNNIIAHSKSSTVLYMLEYLVGEETFWNIFKTSLEKFKGKTVKLEMFKNICEEISARELDWFFHQWYQTSDYLDYRINETKTWKEDEFFITECEIIRHGEAVMPVIVALETKDGQLIKKKIDGWARQKQVVFKSKKNPVRVILDPDQMLPLLSHAQQSMSVVRCAVQQLRRMEKYDQALQLMKNSASIGWDKADYWYYSGLTQKDIGDYLSAIESFKRIKSLKEKDEKYSDLSILQIAKTYDLMGDHKSAEKYYKLALKSNRTREEAEKYLKKPKNN